MLKFAPIMPAFCLLPLYSYYANNFAGKIDASLVNMHVGKEIIMGGWVAGGEEKEHKNKNAYAHSPNVCMQNPVFSSRAQHEAVS